jgi:hypothetical protein
VSRIFSVNRTESRNKRSAMNGNDEKLDDWWIDLGGEG